jgi:hypothetical protein
MTNGRDVFYRDSDNLSMSKHVSTTSGRLRPLAPLRTTGDHVLIIKRHEVIEIPTLWTPLQVEFEREEVQSQPTTLQEGAHHFPLEEEDEGTGFDIRTVTCYRCNKQGHISRDCPQQSWNRNSRGNFQSRGGSRGSSWRGASRNNARTAQVEEESNAEYFDAEPGEEEHQIARAVAGNDEERSKQWLEGVASENDAVKDMIIQNLLKEEDFRGA